MAGVRSSLSLYELVKAQYSSRLSVNHRKAMSWLSRAMELTALDAAKPVRVFSSFQSMQFFLPVLERYKKLAQHARIFVYGYPDITPPPIEGITYVFLKPDDLLVKEWFIIVNSPDFCNALITEEQDYALKTPHGRRVFRGVLTYERDLVQRLDAILSEQIDASQIAVTPTASLNRALAMKMVERLQEATRQVQQDVVLTRELNLIINQYIKPILA